MSNSDGNQSTPPIFETTSFSVSNQQEESPLVPVQSAYSGSNLRAFGTSNSCSGTNLWSNSSPSATVSGGPGTWGSNPSVMSTFPSLGGNHSTTPTLGTTGFQFSNQQQGSPSVFMQSANLISNVSAFGPLFGAVNNCFGTNLGPNSFFPTAVQGRRGPWLGDASLLQVPEPSAFDDDECLNHQVQLQDDQSSEKLKIETYPEVPAVPKTQLRNDFTVLVHVKAPISLALEENTRAPIDLVTVLDISGSMTGTKLALLKRAMGFVIQNLGSRDRLSVIVFSSRARRLFPLRRMSGSGKQQSLEAINSLNAGGGTDIAEGLRKGVKVMEDRRENNPVTSIILLSDGQDNYMAPSRDGTPKNYHLLLPQSTYGKDSSVSKIPVHTFGLGNDHDALLMHSVADISGGTFSSIESEGVIQDAFAQCLGGLLSVVVKDLTVTVDCVHPSLSVNSVRAGSYLNRITADRRTGFVEVGDLYAEEERDFLISVTLPAEDTMTETTSLLKLRCVYTDTLTKKKVTVEGEDVIIQRPEMVPQEMPVVSIEVDRQRNRLEAAEAMAQAKTKAEQGDLSGAASILESFRKKLSISESAKCNDKLCIALDAEMKEMQERVASKPVYEASGRAYILSGLSSHSKQRATAKGGSPFGSCVPSTSTATFGSISMQSLSGPTAPSNFTTAPHSGSTAPSNFISFGAPCASSTYFDSSAVQPPSAPGSFQLYQTSSMAMMLNKSQASTLAAQNPMTDETHDRSG